MAKQQKPRDHARYQFRQNGRITRSGITKRPLEEREGELRREEGGGSIRQVGPRVTEDSAREWEKQQPKGTPPGGR